MAYGSNPFRGRRQSNSTIWAIWIVVAFVIVIIVIASVSAYTHEETVTTLVNDKERVCSSAKESCKYLVYTDAGTFELTDSILIGRWTSSDLYGSIKRCHTYEIKSIGFRLGFTSTYPNIKSVKDLGRDKTCEVN